MTEAPDNQKQEPPPDPSLPTTNGAPPERALPSEQPIAPQSTVRALHVPNPAKPRLPRVKHHALLGQDCLAFYIGDLDDPLVIQTTDRITLGRSGPYGSPPSIDLAPYGAFELGVSRQHAVIYRQAGVLMFEDMHSSNGSYINAERSAPRVPHPVQSGDVIILGRLSLEVYFKPPEGSAQPLTPDMVIPNQAPIGSAPLDAPLARQAFQGSLQFSAANVAQPLELSAELVLYVKQKAGADAQQSLEITISADVNPTQPPITATLERLLKSTQFNLTFSEGPTHSTDKPPLSDK